MDFHPEGLQIIGRALWRKAEMRRSMKSKDQICFLYKVSKGSQTWVRFVKDGNEADLLRKVKRN